MTRVLITNNGTNHSATDWSVATAEQICPTDDINSLGGQGSNLLMAAMRLQLDIAEALIPHHDRVQVDEKSNLRRNAEKHMFSGHDVQRYFDPVLKAIVDKAKGTPFEAHFNNLEVQQCILQVIGSHFASSQHTERLIFADRNPMHETAAKYKAFHLTGTMPE